MQPKGALKMDLNLTEIAILGIVAVFAVFMALAFLRSLIIMIWPDTTLGMYLDNTYHHIFYDSGDRDGGSGGYDGGGGGDGGGD